MPHSKKWVLSPVYQTEGKCCKWQCELGVSPPAAVPFFQVMTPILLFPDAELKVKKALCVVVFPPHAVIIPPAALLQCFYLNEGSNCTESAAAQNKNIILLLNIPLHAVFLFFPRLWILKPLQEMWQRNKVSGVSCCLAFHCRLDKVLCVTST